MTLIYLIDLYVYKYRDLREKAEFLRILRSRKLLYYPKIIGFIDIIII